MLDRKLLFKRREEKNMKSLTDLIKKILNGKFRHISRFSLVGVSNTLIDFLVFTILNSLGAGSAVSQAAGYGCGVVNSFIFNKKWTFQDKTTGKKNVQGVMKFLTINLIILLLTTLAIDLLTDNMGINVYISKVLVTLLAQVINFLGYKLWVFHPGKN